MILIERKIDNFQQAMIKAMTDVWLNENELRKALDAERAQRKTLELRLAMLERAQRLDHAAMDQHLMTGELCPHTAR